MNRQLILFPRKCSNTGKGMYQGFYLNGEYAIDESSADKVVQEMGYKGYSEVANDFEDSDSQEFYWTEWLDKTEIESQGYGYTEDGEEIEINDSLDWVFCLDYDTTEELFKQLHNLQENINRKFYQYKFTEDIDYLKGREYSDLKLVISVYDDNGTERSVYVKGFDKNGLIIGIDTSDTTSCREYKLRDIANENDKISLLGLLYGE